MEWKPNFLETSPLFEPLHAVDNCFIKQADWPDLADFENLKARNSSQVITKLEKPICFVPQETSVRDFTRQYEPRIYLTGEVQTRVRNWHDLFNALVWITFPRAKAALNQLHYQALLHERQTRQMQRGSMRDAATLFDESGVVVVSSDKSLIKLLKNFQWKALFWQRRTEIMKHMKFYVFGHGLYEKALNPYIGMTGKGIVFAVADDFFSLALPVKLAEIDRMLAVFLCQHFTAATDLTPVPVLGYPGWSPDNGESVYYDNSNYFRPKITQNIPHSK